LELLVCGHEDGRVEVTVAECRKLDGRRRERRHIRADRVDGDGRNAAFCKLLVDASGWCRSRLVDARSVRHPKQGDPRVLERNSVFCQLCFQLLDDVGSHSVVDRPCRPQ
jgi:hypothetical protein